MIKEIETNFGKESPDLKMIQAVYDDLINDRTHPNFCCLRPCCLYQLHKKQRGKYSKEIIFLDWLQFEINISLRNRREMLVFDDPPKKSAVKFHIDGQDFIDFLKNRGSLKALSEFVKKHFPKVDHDYKRIKLRLWRFRKSGTLKKLEQEKIREWMKIHPINIKKRDHPLMKFKLLQKIADFIYSQPDRKIIQREICRRYFQKKPVEDLEELRPWLRFNYGIECLKGKRKNQILYVGKMNSSRGLFFKVGV